MHSAIFNPSAVGLALDGALHVYTIFNPSAVGLPLDGVFSRPRILVSSKKYLQEILIYDS